MLQKEASPTEYDTSALKLLPKPVRALLLDFAFSWGITPEEDKPFYKGDPDLLKPPTHGNYPEQR